MTAELDLTKPVQTRDGRKARILCTDLNHPKYSVVAAVTLEDGTETISRMTVKGHVYAHSSCNSDLVNVPEPRSFDWNKPMMMQDGHAVFENEVAWPHRRARVYGALHFPHADGTIQWRWYTEDGLYIGFENTPDYPMHLVNV